MSTLTYFQPSMVATALSTAGDPVWDRAVEERTLTDTDGIAYFGDTPGQCIDPARKATSRIPS